MRWYTSPPTVSYSSSSSSWILMSHRSSRSSTDARPSTRARSSPSCSTSGSSTSYSSWISPTISSSRSSIVTRPAVPPYSSSTIAMWTLRRWNSWSRSSIDIDSGTNTGVRSSVRRSGALGDVGLEERQQVLRVQDADDLVDRVSYTGTREWPSLDDGVERLVERGRRRQRHDRDPRHHHLVQAPVAELDDRVDHLLLLGLEDALLPAALHDQPQLLGRDLGLGVTSAPNRRIDRSA